MRPAKPSAGDLARRFVLAMAVVTPLAGCGGEGVARSTATLRGDPAVLDRYAGNWYLEGDLFLTVRPRAATMTMRYQGRFEISNAWTVEDQIHFTVTTPAGTGDSTLRFSEWGVLVRPPGPLTYTCCTCFTPLQRFRFTDWTAAKTERIGYRVADARERSWDFLISLPFP